jgi:hypothetical protein
MNKSAKVVLDPPIKIEPSEISLVVLRLIFRG